jgi:hypothetical protein
MAGSFNLFEMFKGFEMFINFEGLSIPETPSSFILPVNERSILLN